MPLWTVSLGTIEMAALIYLRVLGLMMTLPVFGSREISTTLRAGLVFAFTLALAGTLMQVPVALPISGFGFLMAAAAELFFGLLAGWLISWVLEAVVVAGQLIGFQMGFAIVNVLDPTTGTAVSIIASFEARLAVMVFLLSGIYRLFLEAIATSFQIVPIGMVQLGARHGTVVFEMFGLIFKAAITLAAAPMISLLAAKVAMGLIGRTVPQMNVFIVGFPLTIGVGLIVTATALPYFIKGIELYFSQGLDRMMIFISSAAP